MPMTISAYDAVLKEVLLPYVRDNYPKATILLDNFKRNAGVTQMNNEFIAPVRTSRHGGIANLANDSSTIPTASGVTYSRGTVAVKMPVSTFDITRLAIDASRSSNLAVTPALEHQAKTLADDYGRFLNRQLYWDGAGVVAQVRQTSGSVSGTEAAIEAVGNGTGPDDGRVQDWYGTINSDGQAGTLRADKYLAAGNRVGIGTGAAAVGTVSALTGSSIQFTGTLSIAASDSVYLVDGSGVGAGTSEFTGIKAALSSSSGTSTYAGLARTVQGWLPAFGSASEALTLNSMQTTYLRAFEYAQQSDKYIILVNQTLYNKYANILSAMRRVVNETALLGGFTGLEFAAGGKVIGVFIDYDVPDGEVVEINLDTWTVCQVSDMTWDDEPGMSTMLRLQNTLSYQAVMHWFANVLCLAPGANGHLTRKTA